MSETEQNNVTTLNIYQRLAKIRDIVDVVEKSKKGFNYTYANISEILAKVKGGMKKYNVSMIPMFVHGTEQITSNEIVNTKYNNGTKTYYDEKKTEMLITGEMYYKFVCNDFPADFISVPWIVVGSQSDPSQAMGSALTYTERQFLTSFFQIAQDNDVDTYRSKQQEAEAAEDMALAAEIISEFDVLVREYFAKHADKKAEVIDLIKAYQKNGNYFEIKDSKKALSMMNTFKEKFKEDK